MKIYLFMLSLVLSTSAAFAQSNEQFKQVAAPTNATELVQSVQVGKVPTNQEGQAIVLEANDVSARATTQVSQDLPPEKRTRIRKGFDAKTKQTLFREVVTQEQLDARNKPKQGPEQRAVVPATKE
jgi:hypothetical protein